MWAILLPICYLVQWARGVLASDIMLSNTDLNSIPSIASVITVADFSKNNIREVNVSSLLDAINLKVRLESVCCNLRGCSFRR